MKTKILSVLIATLVCGVSYAADPVPTVESVSSGNTFERETTPLLRDFSRMKATLEVKKLQREIDKMDEETFKAQAEKEMVANGSRFNPVGTSVPSGQIQNALVTPSMPTSIPQSIAAPVVAPQDDLRISMIYGYDDELVAKMSWGTQGGYAVKKGDILPDGRAVTNITPNYIEVRGSSKNKGKVTRVFVTPSFVPSDNNSNNAIQNIINTPSVNNQGSANITGFAPTNMIANPNVRIASPTLTPTGLPR